ATQATLPETEIQKFIVHQIRNSVKFVDYQDSKLVTTYLKPIYKTSYRRIKTNYLHNEP
ncbi:transposase, partial [Enterococcus faecalis]|nr:transposase [Enterococcus faecalis]